LPSVTELLTTFSPVPSVMYQPRRPASVVVAAAFSVAEPSWIRLAVAS